MRTLGYYDPAETDRIIADALRIAERARDAARALRKGEPFAPSFAFTLMAGQERGWEAGYRAAVREILGEEGG